MSLDPRRFIPRTLGHLVGKENVNVVPSSGSAQTLPDVDTYTWHVLTLTANCTLTFPSPGVGKSFTLKLVQDGTGSRTVTWPSSSLRRFVGGVAPTLSTAAGAIDVFAVVCDDGAKWDVVFSGKGMA